VSRVAGRQGDQSGQPDFRVVQGCAFLGWKVGLTPVVGGNGGVGFASNENMPSSN
jgi:hypothetical protein